MSAKNTPRKRARPSEPSTSSSSTPLSTNTISTLPLAASHELIGRLIAAYPGTTSLVSDFILQHHAAEAAKRAQAPPIDYDHYSKSLWKELNITHAKKSGSKQYDAAFGVGQHIEDAVADMLRGVGKSDRYQTRLSALETMRKVAKSIITCQEGEIMKVVMNGGTPSVIAGGIMEVLRLMDDKEEVHRIVDGEMGPKLRELHKLYDAYAIDDFKVVYDFVG